MTDALHTPTTRTPHVAIYQKSSINCLREWGIVPMPDLADPNRVVVTVGQYTSMCDLAQVLPRLMDVLAKHLSVEELGQIRALEPTRFVFEKNPEPVSTHPEEEVLVNTPPPPAAGQIWEDCDIRSSGRIVRLVETLKDGRWLCERVYKAPDGSYRAPFCRRTKVSAATFRHGAGSTATRGFRFVAEAG